MGLFRVFSSKNNFFWQKSLSEKMFWSIGNKNSSASSPGQTTYTIKISGCCQKIKKIAKQQAPFYFDV
jgi:hypothetical protein